MTIRNLPPFVAEPFMPPEFDVRGWIRLTYIYKGDTEASELAQAGAREAETFRSRTDPNLVIRHAVAGLTASARDDDDKLRRLYEFCQTSIANYTWDNSPAMAPRKAKLEDGGLQNARHTFDARIGSSVDIDYLFAALARAAGFDVRLALNAPRHVLLNVHIQDGWDYMENPTIAVRRGDRWQFFDPGDPFVPFGMNSRENEGAEALLTDAKASTFVAIPASPAEATDRRRKGRFRLDEHGDLEGDVSEILTGHRAEIEREQSLDKPTADLEKTLREAVAKRLPTAELSAVAWENLRARNLPVELHYHVRVPGYAQIAGSRLLWVVNYFGAGSSPAFTSDERHYPILFPFPWSEHDDIEVALPDGYELDQPSAPASIGRDRDAIHATFDLGYVRERHAVSCQSSFVLGADGGVAYPVETYPAMKRVFDALHRSQTHTLVVKPKSVPAKAATAP